MEKISNITKQFQCNGTFDSAEPYGSGHINDTYRVVYDDVGMERHYICQRINHNIFKDVPALMENIGKVVRHQRKKFKDAGVGDLDRRVLTLIPTLDGADYYKDADGNFWRIYIFIENHISCDVVETTEQAFEAAKAFGEFQGQLADLPGRLQDTIPNFHHTRSRFDTLLKAIEEDVVGRVASVKEEIEFVLANEPTVDVVLDLIASGDIPERVTHNDTKLNNVLLDADTQMGMCVIDLDTVMQGSILYDFGDMVRTSTCKAAEDEKDLSKIEMNIDFFEALVMGYLESASSFLLPKEKELLPFSGKLITFEIGLRFLTDYLQGDIYFKTTREGQNLDRCRTQFKLVQSIERQMDEMKKMVEE